MSCKQVDIVECCPLRETHLSHFRGYFEIAIFENQRYRPLHGGWTSEGLLPLERSKFSDEPGLYHLDIDSLDEIACPAGYEWATEWKINTEYTAQDSEGWSYGSTFARISAKLRAKKSAPAATTRHFTRRRLWFRILRPLRNTLPAPHDATELQERRSDASIVPFLDANPQHQLRSSIFSTVDQPIAVTVVENQRRVVSTFGDDEWRSEALLSSDNRFAFSDVSGQHEVSSLADIHKLADYCWIDDWYVMMHYGEDMKLMGLTVDRDGYIYGASFDDITTFLKNTYRKRNESSDSGAGSAQPVTDESIIKASVVRVRCWRRHMTRDVVHSASSYAPFELCIDVRQLSGCSRLSRGTTVQVEIEVDGRGVGETPFVKIKDDIAQFSHTLTLPLVSMTATPIKFRVKTMVPRHHETNFGTVQNDALMNKMMWMKPNKPFQFRYPVTLQNNGTEDQSDRPPVLSCSIELKENSLFKIENMSCIGAALEVEIFEHLRQLISICTEKYELSLIPDDVTRWLTNALSKYPCDRLPLLLLNYDALADIFQDVANLYKLSVNAAQSKEIYSDSSGRRAFNVHPFPSNLHYIGVLSCNAGLRAAQTFVRKHTGVFDAPSPVRADTFTALPVSRRLLDVCDAREDECKVETLFTASIVDMWEREYTFQWDSEIQYVKWLSAMAKATAGVPISYKQKLKAHFDDEAHLMNKPFRIHRAQSLDSLNGTAEDISLYLKMEEAEFDIFGERSQCEWIASNRTPLPQNNENSVDPRGFRKLLRKKTHVQLSLTDIAYVKTRSSFDNSWRFMLTLQLSEVALLDQSPQSSVLVTIQSETGQLQYAHFGAYPLPSQVPLAQRNAYAAAKAAKELQHDDRKVADSPSLISRSECASSVLYFFVDETTLYSPESRFLISMYLQSPVSPHSHTTVPKGEAFVRVSDLLPNLRNTITNSFAHNIPVTRSISLQQCRHAVRINVRSGAGLLASDLNGRSDPFCVVTLVDHLGEPVPGGFSFSTPVVKSNLNPVWNTEKVCDIDSGFLQAMYVHIEIWDKDVFSRDDSLGEVFLPLMSFQEMYIESKVRVRRSPKMTTVPNSTLGTLLVGTQCIYAATQKKRPSYTPDKNAYTGTIAMPSKHGRLKITCSLSLASASSAGWVARPVGAKGTSLRESDVFVCSSTPDNMVLTPYKEIVEPTCWSSTTESIGRRKSLKPNKKSRASTSGAANGEMEEEEEEAGGLTRELLQSISSISNSSVLPRIQKLMHKRQESGMLTHCRESNAVGVVTIPWDQVELVEAISDSMLLLSFRIGRSFGPKVYRDATIQMLVGPCPARNLQSYINDYIALAPLRSSVRNLLVVSELSMDELVEARECLYDVSQALEESSASIKEITSRISAPLPSIPLHPLLKHTLRLPTENNSSSDVILAEHLSFSLQRHARIQLYLANLIHQCSTHCDVSPTYAVDDIKALMDQQSILHGVYNVKHASDEEVEDSGILSHEDLEKVIDLFSLLEGYISDMALCGWKWLVPNSRSRSGTPVLDEVAGAPITQLFDHVVNGYFNRIISLIGKYVDNTHFEELKGQQTKLSLIHFVVVEDDRLAHSLGRVFSALGMLLSPLPRLSASLNVEELLMRFGIVLTSEINVYVKRAMTIPSGSVRMIPSAPWQVNRLDNSLCIGPVPECVMSVLSTYMKMMSTPDATLHKKSSVMIHRMNNMIASSVVLAYMQVAAEFDMILANLNDEIEVQCNRDGHRTSLPEDIAFSHLIFLCSVANDCHRMIESHLPLLEAKVIRPEHELDAMVKKVQNQLMFVGQNAIDLLVKVVFMDIEELLVTRFPVMFSGAQISSPTSEKLSTLITILGTIQDYCGDLKRYLYPPFFDHFVLVCSHKLIIRYFTYIYDVSLGIVRSEAGNVVKHRGMHFLSEWLHENDTSAWTKHTLESDVVDAMFQHKEMIYRSMLECFGGEYTPSKPLSSLFMQFHLFLEALQAKSSSCDFLTAIYGLLRIGASSESILCICRLKGMSLDESRRFAQSTNSGNEVEPSVQGLLTNAKLECIYAKALKQVFMGDVAVSSQEEEHRFHLLDLIHNASRSIDHSPLKRDVLSIMHLTGKLIPMLDISDIRLLHPEAASLLSSVSIRVSALECRGLRVAQTGLGKAEIFVRICIGRQRPKTAPVPSSLCPKWADSINVSLQSYRAAEMVFEVVEHNWLLDRSKVLASYTCSLNSLSLMSPLDGWHTLKATEQLETSPSKHRIINNLPIMKLGKSGRLNSIRHHSEDEDNAMMIHARIEIVDN